MAKPTVKLAAKEEAPLASLPKSRKMRTISLIVLLLFSAGGAGFYFAGHRIAVEGHGEPVQPEAHQGPRFIALGENFTVNLQREDGDHTLQAGITLKTLQPELEAKIKTALPEIRSRLLLLLSSKKPSELLTPEGKKKLIVEARTETNTVLGVSMPEMSAAAEDATPATSAVAPAPAVRPARSGAVDVLFTSFFIR